MTAAVWTYVHCRCLLARNCTTNCSIFCWRVTVLRIAAVRFWWLVCHFFVNLSLFDCLPRVQLCRGWGWECGGGGGRGGGGARTSGEMGTRQVASMGAKFRYRASKVVCSPPPSTFAVYCGPGSPHVSLLSLPPFALCCVAPSRTSEDCNGNECFEGKKCACDEMWTGPQCLAAAGFDDYVYEVSIFVSLLFRGDGDWEKVGLGRLLPVCTWWEEL